MSRLLAPVLRVVTAAATVVVAQSVLWSTNAPPVFVGVLVLLAALSAWRPAWGLVALAALAPFGRMLAVVWLDGFLIRGAEALALACLSGLALRGVTGRTRGPHLLPLVRGPWILYGAAALASAAVLHRVSQFHLDYPLAFLGRLVRYLAVDYHGLPGDPRPWLETTGFGHVGAAVLVLEGIAILMVTARLCAATPGLAKRLLMASALGAAIAGALSVAAVVEAALATGQAVAALPELLFTSRLAVHINKVNTAGSYFVLMAGPAIGLALIDRSRRALWAVAIAFVGAGLWLTGSLAAFLGGVLAATWAGVAWALGAGGLRTAAGRLAIAAVAALVLVGAWRASTRDNALQSLGLRWAITSVTLATAADRPVFGVGIGTYALRSQPYITDEVRAGFGEGGIQAHNYLLQIAAELGIVGLGLFLWCLAGVARAAVSPDLGGGDTWAVPAALGLAAFFVSSLSGQPMLVDTVAIPASLLIGVVLARAATAPTRGTSWWIVAGVAAIAATVPFRAAREVGEIDPRRAGYGTTFDVEASGRPVHWLEGRARLFVHRSSVAVRVEALAPGADEAGPIFLQISSPGLTTPPLLLEAGGARSVCVPFDAAARSDTGPFRAIDLEPVTATGAPAPPLAVWATVVGLDRPCASQDAESGQRGLADVYLMAAHSEGD